MCEPFSWIRVPFLLRLPDVYVCYCMSAQGGKESVLDTLCDFIDSSGDGTFGYREFSSVLSAEDVMQCAPNHPVVMKQ